MDVRIGIFQSGKEVEVELGDDVDRDALVTLVDSALEKGDGVLQLTDRRGRRVSVPVPKVSYVEIGAPSTDRRVGFGAP